MQAVVDGVVKTLVASTKVTRGALWWVVGFKNLLDGVTNSEIGPVHMAGDHKKATDGQMVVSDICEPQRFTLRMESTEERENRGTSTFRTAKRLSQ